MTFNFDFSQDKPDIRVPIPAGTPLFLQMTYTAGGAGPDGALTESQNTDAQYLKTEFTVLRGPYRGRKFWGNLTVSGGKVDEKGQSIAAGITRKTIRLMLDSAFGLKSTDESPEAAQKRVLPNGFKSLQGIRFIAKAKVEAAQNGYPEKNGLGQVMTIEMKGYPSETELDAPPVPGKPSMPAPAAPAWQAAAGVVQPNSGAVAAAAPIVVPQTVAAGVAQTFAPPAPMAPPPGTPPSADNGGIPLWAMPAAA